MGWSALREGSKDSVTSGVHEERGGETLWRMMYTEKVEERFQMREYSEKEEVRLHAE